MNNHTNHRPSAVLVTGSSTGIGEACAIALDRRGYRVFAGVRSAADAQRLRSNASAGLEPVLLDITDSAAIAAAATLLDKTLGEAGLAGLVNNAGIVVAGPLELLPIEEVRRQFEVNVVGHVAVTQAMLPLLRKARGRIVNISSDNGALAPPYLGPYAASKHAMEALSDSLRLELRRWGISVSLIETGSVQTPIWDKSRAAADSLAEHAPPEAIDLYRADLAAVRKAAERLAKRSIPPERVVREVLRALTDRRPKARYFVSFETRLCYTALRIAPFWLRDWLVREGMKLP
ncbi:MAG: SDR family oxidoreductase [Thermoguttaceae bacterium]